MKKYTSLLLVWTVTAFAQPANDNCSNATNLTIDASITCGETAQSATLQGSECYVNYAGNTETTTWYRITANNDSLVINFVQTNTSDCFATLNIYGPFASGAGCIPACGTNIYSSYLSGDPGQHILLTGWTSGSDYLIQIQNNSCGGPFANHVEYCIGVATPATNALSSGASQIDQCGTSFSETTDGGYWNSGTGTGFANLDNNASTSCSTCAAGLDVPYVINNAAWNTFCSLTDGMWSVTVDNVTNCALTGAGVQASVFTGTTTALNNEDNSSPVPATGWTSLPITVNSGDCAYLLIDGFAGDICDYDVTLTNISGGCEVLPLELIEFSGETSQNATDLWWKIASASDIQEYQLERSFNGEYFEAIIKIPSIGDHDSEHLYTYTDEMGSIRNSYYRLSSVDNDGNLQLLSIKYFHRNNENYNGQLKIFPNPAIDNINIQLENNSAASVVEIFIHSIDGAFIKSFDRELINGFNEIEVNVQDLSTGKYFLTILGENQLKNSSFFVK